MEKKTYSLIACLEGEEYKKVRGIQKELSELTGSRKCLEDWQPHITIGDGPLLSEEELKDYILALETFVKNNKSVTAKLTDFAGIDNWKGARENITPYVLWANVEVSGDLLNIFNTLRDNLTSKYETWLPRTVNYVPHVTVAFADLDEEGYRKGLDFLSTKNLNTNFKISHVSIVECYGEGNMTSVEYRRFYFSA